MGGSRHSSPNAMRDILLVMDVLLRENILSPQPGWYSVGPSGAHVMVQETVDMFDIGSNKVKFGGVVEALLARWRNTVQVPWVPDMTAEGWAAEFESVVAMWNKSVQELQHQQGHPHDSNCDVLGSGDMDVDSSDGLHE